MVKNPPASARDAGDVGLIPKLGRCPGEGHGNPCSVLAWKISQTEEPDELQFMGLQRVGHNLATKQKHRLYNTKCINCGLWMITAYQCNDEL